MLRFIELITQHGLMVHLPKKTEVKPIAIRSFLSDLIIILTFLARYECYPNLNVLIKLSNRYLGETIACCSSYNGHDFCLVSVMFPVISYCMQYNSQTEDKDSGHEPKKKKTKIRKTRKERNEEVG